MGFLIKEVRSPEYDGLVGIIESGESIKLGKTTPGVLISLFDGDVPKSVHEAELKNQMAQVLKTENRAYYFSLPHYVGDADFPSAGVWPYTEFELRR